MPSADFTSTVIGYKHPHNVTNSVIQGWDSLGKIGFEYSAAEVFEFTLHSVL